MSLGIDMSNTIFIGFEGHDGTGKSTNQRNLARWLNAEIYLSNEDSNIKGQRDAIYGRKSSSKQSMEWYESNFLKEVEEIYETESKFIQSKFENSEVVVMDRTWVSHASEENILWSEKISNKKKNIFPSKYFSEKNSSIDVGNEVYPANFFPENVIRPSVIFEIILEEELRVKRIFARGEELNKRELRIQEDHEYRTSVEEQRMKFGLIPLRIRERDEVTCSLRAVQILLGSKNMIPRKINNDLLTKELNQQQIQL